MRTKKKTTTEPSILDMIEDSLYGLNNVVDVKTTIREFNKLRFPEPKEYKPKDITILREKKLNMSQAAFAVVCNAKVSTLQKWESGVNKPTPPVYRLFQLIEAGGLSSISP